MRVSPYCHAVFSRQLFAHACLAALDLTDAERHTLRDARKRHDKPYVRERAAALLKIDDGWHRRKVAREGLLQSRTPDTVYTWYHGWQDHGIAALYIEEGDGRKPALSP